MKRKCNYCTRFQFADDRVLCPKAAKEVCHLYDPNKFAMEKELIELKDKCAELIEAIYEESHSSRLSQLSNQIEDML